MKREKYFYLCITIPLFLILLFWLIIKWKYIYNLDFAAYCAISRALFEGKNPFPDHYDVLFCNYHWGETVPIVYPGQMLFFTLPSYLWSQAIQNIYILLNILIIFYIVGITLINACGYQRRNLWMPSKKQFLFVLICILYFLSWSVKASLGLGQIPIILTICLYGMFWGSASRYLRIFLFAFIAVTKYSLLPVFALLLFFKGHWKLCIAAFSVFVFLSLTPVFFGNNLIEVYSTYFQAVNTTIQPGNLNHYNNHPADMLHLGFFKISIINTILKIFTICLILWLFWREYKIKTFSDTLMLLAFSLTMLISYHRCYDLVIIYPLFIIRLFDFYKKKQWSLFGITILFPLFLNIPESLRMKIYSLLMHIPKIDSIVYTYDVYSTNNLYFPILPIFSIVLSIWSLYLYLHVKEPYQFEIPSWNSTFKD